MRMKFRQIYLVVLILLLIAAISFSCASKNSSTAATTQQLATVQKGTLRQEVTASGNLALSKTADLAFDVSGYVYRVLVEEGDSVKEGQLVAEVDSFDWEKQKRTLERAVVLAKVSVNNAQISLEKAQNPTTTTSTISGSISAPDPLDIETKRLQLEQAKMSLDDAEKELERYLETSAQIVAPFDGFVTAVKVKGGDEIFKGAIAVSIADPTKFESDILVNEMDINRIEIGMTATVQLMASSTSIFPAKVTAIAPTATNQSGVINYKVKVELLTAEEIRELRASQAQSSSASPSGRPPSGQPPSGQSSQGTRPQSGQSSTGRQAAGSATNMPMTLEQLRDGLSVTVTVIIQEKQNVLMVLSRAISRQGTDSVVKIPKGETVETRVVKTGISNSSYTEILEGLSEGEQVVIGTTTTTTTQQSTPPGPPGPPLGGMRIIR
jgi:RND family efflux transporter MFP subunit